MTYLKKSICLIIATIVIGILLLGRLILGFDNTKKQDFLRFLNTIQAAINSERVESLTGTEADLSNSDYLRLTEQLTKLASSYPKVKYVYLMQKLGDKVVFLVDAKSLLSDDKELLATPGEEYLEVTDTLLSVFESGNNTAVGPEKDKWGIFISALGPIYSRDGKLLAIVGVDIDASDWDSGRIKYIIPYAVALIFLLIIEVIGLQLLLKYQTHQRVLSHLANIVESSHDAIFSMNLDGTIRSWNKGAQEMFGYTSAEALGKKGFSLVYKEDQKDKYDKVSLQVGIGQKTSNFQIKGQSKGGRTITTLTTANPIYEDGRVVGTSIVAKDITVDHGVKRNLAQRIDELEKLNQLMIDRELKMMELKNQITELNQKK